VTHSGLTTGKTGVPRSACHGKLKVLLTRRVQAGPRIDMCQCDDCGAKLAVCGGVIIADGVSDLFDLGGAFPLDAV
jgi:hypothetical protein